MSRLAIFVTPIAVLVVALATPVVSAYEMMNTTLIDLIHYSTDRQLLALKFAGSALKLSIVCAETGDDSTKASEILDAGLNGLQNEYAITREEAKRLAFYTAVEQTNNDYAMGRDPLIQCDE